MNNRPMEGLIAASFTPFDSNGDIDLAALPELVSHLENAGVSGLYVLGSTGEGVSLSDEERRETAEAFIGAAKGRLPVVVQVGHGSLRSACELARHAVDAGADAVSAVAPSYFKIRSLHGLIGCLREITDAAGEAPFYYYHIPHVTGIDLDMPELMRLTERELPTMRGIKFSSPDLSAFQGCLQRAGDREVFFGVDEMLLGALATGARAAVGSTYNFATPLYLAIIDAFNANNITRARRLQSLSGEMVRIIMTTCGQAGLKAVMPLIGIDCGPTRRPLATPTPGQIEEMRLQLDAIGFFRWSRDPDEADFS